MTVPSPSFTLLLISIPSIVCERLLCSFILVSPAVRLTKESGREGRTEGGREGEKVGGGREKEEENEQSEEVEKEEEQEERKVVVVVRSMW